MTITRADITAVIRQVKMDAMRRNEMATADAYVHAIWPLVKPIPGYSIDGLTAPQLREINGALATAQAAAQCGDDNGLTSLRAINNARERVHEAMERQGVNP